MCERASFGNSLPCASVTFSEFGKGHGELQAMTLSCSRMQFVFTKQRVWEIELLSVGGMLIPKIRNRHVSNNFFGFLVCPNQLQEICGRADTNTPISSVLSNEEVQSRHFLSH